jgi:hypothetical protein
MFRRHWKQIVVIVLLLATLQGDAIPVSRYFDYRLGALVGAQVFDFLHWEVWAVTDKLAGRSAALKARDLSPAERDQLLQEYFALSERLGQLQDEIQQRHSQGEPLDSEQLKSLQDELAQVRAQHTALKSQVEAIISGQIETVLAEQGFTAPVVLRWLGDSFPPVEFEFDRLPLYLIISPRDKIELQKGIYLRADLSPQQIEALEAQIDRLGVSSYITGIGGVSTYPSMLFETSPFEFAIFASAHEWFHDYLGLRPLGWNYKQSGDAAAINETVADIAGSEIGDIVYARYYGRERAKEPEEPTVPPQGEPEEFNFNREMRSIRLHVDELLQEGKVAEAEAFMEERRQFLATKGYYLRKLNQAYFAFYGSYTDAPTSVDPLGGQLKELRQRSPSLKAFIDTVSTFSSRADVQAALEKAK